MPEPAPRTAAVTVRPATAADAAALHTLAALTFPLACPPHTTDEATAAFIAGNLSETSFTGYLADPDRELFVAETVSPATGAVELAGYTMLVHGEPTDPDVAGCITARPTTALDKCYVHPDHHGAGVAQALVTASVEAARRRGSAGIWLGVNQENERANRFYAKVGFDRVGRKRFLVGDRYEDDFVRERVL
ncbi:GNAT family N-acetyltransferase [Nakamurella leprariae]|uniref:GNAT family N-acetyltransferase n=1 Tax=Nakamurella leprariae TaxID=2803911 RepID=A0A939BZH1_9ACTN|nr:GNAT family N-acetyltransferase [Nakamurella leprariae]MBM9468145.1 GNAT family N-acetyltransferase [Nakamurella leprariae]